LMARDLELSGIAKADGSKLDALALEYARVAGELTELKNA